MLRIVALLILTFNLSVCFSQEAEKAALIVTYQIESGDDLLRRVRFWVEDENHKAKLYPRKEAFVIDPERKIATVVIGDLLPGSYVIRFLVPNIDGLFDKVPERRVDISDGETVRIDRIIRVQTAAREAPAAESPVVEKRGKLIVSYDGGPDDTHVSLLMQGSESVPLYLGESGEVIDFANGRMIVIDNIKPGSYLLRFISEGETLDEQEVEIEEGNTLSVHRSLEKPARGEEGGASLLILTNTSEAVFELINKESREKMSGTGQRYLFSNLPHGSYEIVFSGSNFLLVPPNKISLELQKDKNEEINAEYRLLGRLRINSDRPNIRLTISEMEGNISPIQAKMIKDSGEWLLPPGEYRLTFHYLKDGSHPPKPKDVEIKALETVAIFVEYR